MNNIKKILYYISVALFIFSFKKINAEEINLAKNAKSAILVESTTGKILYEKESNMKRSPASMTKIMTLLLTMESIESGKIKYNDEVLVSKKAASMGGTQIFIEEGNKIDILTLIKGISIASANDAAVAIAEYIGGTEENFVKMMNDKATELGCTNTNFKNPHGLDEENHYTTAYDLSLIARELLKYEKILEFTSIYETYINVSGENHWLVNTNKLIKYYNGIDGLKTGYTNNALYCLTATMKKNNMRVISIVMGEDSKENRNSDTISMMEYAFSTYGIQTILKKDEYKGSIAIDNVKNKELNYYLSEDVNIVVKKGTNKIEYETKEEIYNLVLPINKKSKIGQVKIEFDNNTYFYDLIVNEKIEKSSFLNILIDNIRDIITGNKII